jgi:uncharacterized repeat protein (TIGR03803 family)
MVMMALCLLGSQIAAAQVFATIALFGQKNGANPIDEVLAQGLDGSLYGTTSTGGRYGEGTIFKVGLKGDIVTLYSFCADGKNCADGAGPHAGLVLGRDGEFYGTTRYGGEFGEGTVFRTSAMGQLTRLHSFCSAGVPCADGAEPLAKLIQGIDGNFYGTTVFGGANGFTSCALNCGTVFKITPRGNYTVLYSFCSETGCLDGAGPEAGLVQGTDGSLYGTAFGGGLGPAGDGTLFQITPMGKYVVLHQFCSEDGCADGLWPWAAPVVGVDGNIYCTTYAGGVYGYGLFYKVSTDGIFTALYSIDNRSGTESDLLEGNIIQASDGNFYGTSVAGGLKGAGSIYRITPDGNYALVHSFVGGGGQHYASYFGLMQATDGNLYGTSQYAGDYNRGTVFGLALGIAPFVQALPSYGVVGTTVRILGTKMSGVTAVTFNGVPATFTVISESSIKTTVPVDATDGPVQVTTASGTLTSSVSFRVRP